MAKGSQKWIIVSGDEQVVKLLNSLGRRVAGRLHKKASLKAANVVLAKAKTSVPHKTGAFARSLMVTSIERSRTRMGHMVTQDVAYAHKKKHGGTVTSERATGFYGVYVELGYVASGRPHSKHRTYEALITASNPGFRQRESENLQEDVTTYRGTTFKVGQLKGARKVPGRWVMRNAGKTSEPKAIEIYQNELQSLIDEEASK